MRAIITVIGRDRVGIIAPVCGFLSEKGLNILDISQTIVQGFFNMLMIVDVTNADILQISDGLQSLGDKLGVQIKLQNEEIFTSMHRI